MPTLPVEQGNELGGARPRLWIALRVGFAFIALTFTAWRAGPVAAQPYARWVDTVYSPVQRAGDAFGLHMYAGNGLIAVSDPNRDLPLVNSGSVHLIDARWHPVAQVLDPNLQVGAFFGTAMHVDPDGVLLGNWRDDRGGSNAGAAYAYDRQGHLRLELFSPSPDPDDRFGYTVAQVVDNLLAPAYKDDTLAVDAGAGYLFDGRTGELLHTFYDPTPAPGDRFGHSCSSWGKYAVISCYRESRIAPSCGAVYLFDSEDGSLFRTIDNPKPEAADLFGKAVAVQGNRLVVTAIGDKAGYSFEVGSAFVYDLTTGALLHEIVNPNPLPESQFGEVVAFVGDDILVGAPEVDIGGQPDVGAAYLFSGKTGELLATLANPDPTANDYYGRSVAGLGDFALVGSPFDDSSGLMDSGAVYAFQTSWRSTSTSADSPSWFGGRPLSPEEGGVISVPEPSPSWLAVTGLACLVGAWSTAAKRPAL